MINSKNSAEKLWIGFGILTIMSGIGLIFMNKYLIGISGSIVGVWLISQNWKQLKEKNNG